jgi:uncharacterized protein (TIGR03435 family)
MQMGAQTATTATFAVATIKPGKHVSQNGQRPYRGGYEAKDATVKDLIAFAYDVPFGEDDLISGGPRWAYTSTFDIEAKSEADVDATRLASQNVADTDLDRMMLQSLLATRFGLKVHRETVQLPAFALVVSGSGTKLQPIKPSAAILPPTAADKPMMRLLRGDIHAPKATMNWLAGYLQFQPEMQGRPVADKTGLAGEFDISLKWSPEGMQGGETPKQDPNSTDLFTALQEQLGLKLKRMKVPADAIVIDQVQRPSEN